MKTKWLRGAASAVAIAMLSSCASSGFVSSWQAPDAEPLQVSGSKVAAVVMMSEESSRRAAEDALARELTARGAIGVALYTVLPDAHPDNEAAVRTAMEQAGVAGAVVMRPVSTRTEVVATPDTFVRPAYGRFWGGYYGFGWGDPWIGVRVARGDIRTETIVSVETLVYSLRQNKLVWGGQSETTNSSSVDRLVRSTAAKVAKELERRGLIPG
jgi:hypothetical protein